MKVIGRIWDGQAVEFSGNYNCMCVEFYENGIYVQFDKNWNVITSKE